MAAATPIRIQKPILSLFSSKIRRINPVRLAPTHIRFCNPYQISALKLNSTKPSTLSSLKCFIINNPKVVIHRIDEHDYIFDKKLKDEKNPLEKFILEAHRHIAIVVFFAGLLLCLVFYPNSVFAASGGRMGGESFSSSRHSSSSGSYTSCHGHSHSSSYPYSCDGYSSSSCYDYSSPSYYSSPFWIWLINFLYGFSIVFLVYIVIESYYNEQMKRISVLKLQVSLLGSAKSLQRDLNRIAETKDSSTPQGLNYILTESISTLRQHSEYCISGYSSVDVNKSLAGAETRFKKLSIEEREKYDEETLVNFNNTKKRSSTIFKPASHDQVNDEYIVVTILVVTKGKSELLPTINSSSNLEEALKRLASIPTSETVAVEVLWTPQNEDDALSKTEFLEKYQLLQPLLE